MKRYEGRIAAEMDSQILGVEIQISRSDAFVSHFVEETLERVLDRHSTVQTPRDVGERKKDGDVACDERAKLVPVQSIERVEELADGLFRSSRGAQNLLRLGLEEDVVQASQHDLFDLVPEWSSESNTIN